ncbi:MAG: SIMPL domain-containing protein [Patescibacteria group bacterium]|nr:SIMPL domain-containing protein [Patescibacteria group bacterium]MBU2509127.1 SIMPL domain-containing protein [Patescibacteria group bacterium]
MKNILYIFLFSVIAGSLVLAGTYFIPWKTVDWGKLEFKNTSSVSVTGEAKTQLLSQAAEFSAGVWSIKDNKDAAVTEVNNKINELVDAVKKFGIEASDIKTQNISVYLQEESYYDEVERRQKSRPGQWKVNNSISIKLKDLKKTNELANLLTGSGATEVWGPSFSIDDMREAEVRLLKEAIANARIKAQEIAMVGERKLGRIITVTEGSGSADYGIAYGGFGGGGSELEPGSTTIHKNVTVTFELE